MAISKNTIHKFILGDNEATGAVFEEYRNLLYFIIASYISNPSDCDDVLSETYLKAMLHRNEIKNPSKLKSFLSSIAKNEALLFLKKQNRNTLIYIDEIYGEDDKNNSLLEEINPLLSNKETIILYYRAVFSYSWKEINQETGIPISSAKLIYKKAKEKVRKELL